MLTAFGLDAEGRFVTCSLLVLLTLQLDNIMVSGDNAVVTTNGN